MLEKINKNKIITIRVSDQEYQEFRSATSAKGYRTVSELARAAMRTLSGKGLAPHQVLERRVDEHAARLDRINREIDRLLILTRDRRE